MRLIDKFKTLLTVDKRWLWRYVRKYSKQNIAFLIARMTGRTYWDVSPDFVHIKLSFSTPYHQAIAREMHDGIYERSVMSAWLSLLPNKKVIYDIGGFNGIYGLVAAKKNPHATVTIFEPDHTNAEQIRANIMLNALSNCSVQEAAVSEKSGIAHFSQGGTSGEHLGTVGAEVKVVALRDLKAADLIKIDVEGAELNVLRGMGYRADALLEVHPLFISRFETTEKDIADFLSREKYNVTFLEERDKAKHYQLRV